MSYFPIMSEQQFSDEYPELNKEVLDLLGIGFIPNIFRCLASTNPELALASWTMVKNNLCSGELPRVSKEILFSYIAYRRKCEYCHVAHHAMAIKFGHKEQDILEIIKNIDSIRNPSLKKIIEFGELCLQNDFSPEPNVYDELEDIGFDQEEITELIGMVSCSLYMVNIADSLAVTPDKGFYQYTESAA